MDALSEVLRTIKLRGAVYFRRDFASPWGMDMDISPFAQFHMVVRGHCWLQIKGAKQPLELSSGDIVVFPHGHAHSLADDLAHPRLPGRQIMQAICNDEPVFKGKHVSTTLVCGHFEFDRNVDHPFLHALPEFIYLADSDHHELSWLETATNVIIQETSSGNPGADVVVERLAEVLFIRILRTYMQRAQVTGGFLAALRDAQICNALNLIHKKPEATWTLANIARTVGMSRSAFAARFKKLVSMTAMDYITNWRMQKACELLENTRLPLIDIAERVGYNSEAAFNRAFKRRLKQNPGAMRRILWAKDNQLVR